MTSEYEKYAEARDLGLSIDDAGRYARGSQRMPVLADQLDDILSDIVRRGDAEDIEPLARAIEFLTKGKSRELREHIAEMLTL